MAKNFMKAIMDKQPEGPINTKELISTIESGYLVGREPQFKTKKSFSPSSLVWGSGACPRYWFLAFSGAEFVDDATPYDVANMNSGTQADGLKFPDHLPEGFPTRRKPPEHPWTKSTPCK